MIDCQCVCLNPMLCCRLLDENVPAIGMYFCSTGMYSNCRGFVSIELLFWVPAQLRILLALMRLACVPATVTKLDWKREATAFELRERSNGFLVDEF